MRFLLGSGYINSKYHPIPSRTLFRMWLDTIYRWANPEPQRIILVTSAGSDPRPEDWREHATSRLWPEIIHCRGDIGNLAAGTMKYDYSGWMPPVVLTAMLAYNDELDFIHQEQDCFAFGSYIQQLYSDCGDAGMVIGRPLKQMGMPATQSLFLVRHRYIPTFIRDYLALGGDDNQTNKGEYKFARLRQNNPHEVAVASFGQDRDRPIAWDDPVIAVQQCSKAELDEAKRRGLIL